MTFKEKLVILRKMKGITQDDFASAVGVSRQAVYKWECGQSYPEVPKLLEMKLLFGISLDELLDDSYDIPIPEKKKKRISRSTKQKIEASVETHTADGITPTSVVMGEVAKVVDVKPEAAPAPKAAPAAAPKAEPAPAPKAAPAAAPKAEPAPAPKAAPAAAPKAEPAPAPKAEPAAAPKAEPAPAPKAEPTPAPKAEPAPAPKAEPAPAPKAEPAPAPKADPVPEKKTGFFGRIFGKK